MSASRQELERLAARMFRARGGADVLRPAEFTARARPAEPPAPVPVARTAERLDFSLMFFSAEAGDAARPDLYRLVQEAARFADARGFAAVWLPERHFHPFGGPYPDPAVLAASLATITSRVRLRAGSIVLPLHHPALVAETWSMVDNLSNGRVELGFGSGWNPNDFVVSPDTYGDARAVMRQRIKDVRALWRGEALDLPNGLGETVPTRIYPAPVQADVPVWLAATGNPDTFAWAGANGFNILTMLLGGDIDDIAPKIALYRQARQDAGLDPEAGRVGLMLHSFVHPDGDFARATIRAPFMDYVRGSVDVQRFGSDEGRAMTEAQRDGIVRYAFERYTRSAALFGSPEECRPMLDRAAAAGVDEIACLIDFGVDESLVLDSLQHLDALRPVRPETPAAMPVAAARPTDEPIAIVGMSGRFPGSPDLAAFWDNLRAGRCLLREPPPGRGGEGVPPLGGYLDDVDGFDAGLFGIAPAEAAAMDPHQRVFLEQVWAALEDAGYRPSVLRGQPVGVFAAIYSHSHESALRARGEALDGLAVAGAVLSMVPNRTSFQFDWTGPSEAVNTACSSGLVAVHRAVGALRGGECTMAVAGGVSLLLAPEETAALARLGILAPDGVCRSFDRDATGQARGEGAGVVLLKRLSDAERDGDFIHAVIRGSAVNHGGARASSLTLPNPRLQADCMAQAIRRSGIDPDRIGFIEAHGAGTAIGDLSELSAFGQALENLEAPPAQPLVIGSVKANVGSLDAAGGIAGLIKAALALRFGEIPPMPNRHDNPEGFDPSSPFRFADPAAPLAWPTDRGRVACVHAYGLGGTNAHVVLEQAPVRPVTAAPAGPHGVTVSARSEAALRATIARLADWLDSQTLPPALADVAHTLAIGREPLPHAWRVTVSDVPGLRSAMRAWLSGAATLSAAGGGGHDTGTGPGRRIPLPGHAFDRPERNVVGAFYDFVTRAEDREGDVFLTLAPFPGIVPGFSWTRTFQDPDRHPDHWALIQDGQREMREMLFSTVDWSRVRRVLDFGCGVGSDLIALARAHPAVSGVGYTVSARQAAIAQRRIAAAGLSERVTVHHRDSARDAFPGQFDVVIGFEVAHHIAGKQALFGNIASHLSPAGWLLLADCAANTVAPIDLPDVGSFTSPKPDYADLLAEHGLEISECVDLSQEIANFLHDPGLEAMLAREAASGGKDVALMEAVQRSWDGFGQALRSGLLSYLLISARPRPGASGLAERNRRQLGVA
ncbi:MAG: MupA/Atu3671 family FMN-dependent luciferase-like monooxygenase [Acetobacteraceae bacterium]